MNGRLRSTRVDACALLLPFANPLEAKPSILGMWLAWLLKALLWKLLILVFDIICLHLILLFLLSIIFRGCIGYLNFVGLDVFLPQQCSAAGCDHTVQRAGRGPNDLVYCCGACAAGCRRLRKQLLAVCRGSAERKGNMKAATEGASRSRTKTK